MITDLMQQIVAGVIKEFAEMGLPLVNVRVGWDNSCEDINEDTGEEMKWYLLVHNGAEVSIRINASSLPRAFQTLSEVVADIKSMGVDNFIAQLEASEVADISDLFGDDDEAEESGWEDYLQEKDDDSDN